MTGEPPEDLGLELPDGPRHPLPGAASRSSCELPGYVAEGTGGVALTGLGERSTALRVAMAVAGERLYDAVRARARPRVRARGRLHASSTRDLGHAFLGSDCHDEDAERGPAGELSRTRARPGRARRDRGGARAPPARRPQRARTDPDRLRRRLDYEALGELTGGPVLTDEESERELEALDAAAVAAAMELRQAHRAGARPGGLPAAGPGDVAPRPRGRPSR